jgi:peptidoglycan/xylan/chitin deacetylase (PgdA/CDA1 family)
MDRRQALAVIAAGAAGFAAGIGPDLWHDQPRHVRAGPTKPTPPPDPGFAPVSTLLHDLTPTAPANAIALTIDDGPHPYWTPKILDVLAEFDVPATFNMIGIQVPDNTRLVQRIVAAGHQIADHTLTHPLNLPNLPTASIEKEIGEARDRIAQACSVAPRFFRAPGGAWSQPILDIAAAHQMICLGWDIDPRDWSLPGIPHITTTLQEAKPGDILLCHDGGGDRAQTVAALRTVIPALKQRGLTFVAL